MKARNSLASLNVWSLSLLIVLLTTPSLYAQEGRGKDRIEVYPEALHYLVVGDWGQGTRRQREVAVQMAKVSEQVGVDFIVTTGDNFYPSGVSSTRDSLWKTAFEDVYAASSLKVPWYPVLGNHDYGGDPDAQVMYSKVSDRWKMPSRYYRMIFPLKNDTTSSLMLLFIDTTPLIPGYYGHGLAVDGYDTTAQIKWIGKMLEDLPSHVKWTFVIGHHPIYTAGERRDNVETEEIRRILKPLFERSGITGYLAGHEHNLQHLVDANGVHQFVSGGGSEARLIKPFVPRRFARAASGFILFSVLKNKVVAQVINRRGRVLYRYAFVPRKRA
jgi:tartrate-resistant acid phosphatase type 5